MTTKQQATLVAEIETFTAAGNYTKAARRVRKLTNYTGDHGLAEVDTGTLSELRNNLPAKHMDLEETIARVEVDLEKENYYPN